MKRPFVGALNPMWSMDAIPQRQKSKHKVKVHLRVGEGRLAGPACGNDLRSGSTTLTLTGDLEQVTCGICRRSIAFQRLTE